MIFSSFHPFLKDSQNVKLLNREDFKYKKNISPIPSQTKNYINVVNYNVRTCHLDKGTWNEWDKRKGHYFRVLCSDDEACKIMETMQETLQHSVKQHLPEYNPSKCQQFKVDDDCTTCKFRKKEPYPVHETKCFRIALKTGFIKTKQIYGYFPYPYRLIISLKRHASAPSKDEWNELWEILTQLETKVCQDLGAEYSSYASLQDKFYLKKREKNVISDNHFFIHFIFRFPQGVKIRDVCFEDPNPYYQFQLTKTNLVKEGEKKPGSNFIFKRTPDIINSQELTHRQVQDMKTHLPQHQFIGYTAYDGKFVDEVKPDDWIDEIVVIGYKSNRFSCMGHGVRWLSPTPEVPSICPGASRNRIVVWAKFFDKETGRAFYVFNSHYDHIGATKTMVDVEVETIQSIAKDQPWFSTGERFYAKNGGNELYRYFLNSIDCQDTRDASLMGHYGEAGSWGGFEGDPYASKVKDGDFECDTLDVFFTNAKNSSVLLTYTINGAYDPKTQKLYPIDSSVEDDYRLASDHFMIGFYLLFN
jgi:hypothetical protein